MVRMVHLPRLQKRDSQLFEPQTEHIHQLLSRPDLGPFPDTTGCPLEIAIPHIFGEICEIDVVSDSGLRLSVNFLSDSLTLDGKPVPMIPDAATFRVQHGMDFQHDRWAIAPASMIGSENEFFSNWGTHSETQNGVKQVVLLSQCGDILQSLPFGLVWCCPVPLSDAMLKNMAYFLAKR